MVILLAQLFLGEARDPAVEFKTEHQEAVEIMLRQVADATSTALKTRWGDVPLRLELGAPPSWTPSASGWLSSSGEGQSQMRIEWQLSAAVHAAFAAGPPAAEARSGGEEQSPVQPEAVPHAPQDNTGMVEGNLGLLMDVELEVMLRFGGRSMLLRNILELGTGSVVELDRKVDEPADLLLDGKVIARGEVVVVDGNYGLRVLEVLSPRLAG